MEQKITDYKEYAYKPRLLTLPTRFIDAKYVFDISPLERIEMIKERLISGVPIVGSFRKQVNPYNLPASDVDFIVESLNANVDGTYSYTIKLVSDVEIDIKHAHIYLSYTVASSYGEKPKLTALETAYLEYGYFEDQKVFTISHVGLNRTWANYGYFLSYPKNIDELTNFLSFHVDTNKFDIDDLIEHGETTYDNETLLIDTINIGKNNREVYLGKLEKSFYVPYDKIKP